MTEVTVAAAADLPPGERTMVDVDGVTIGVFNVDGEFRAYENWCPHQGGGVCQGQLTGTVESSFDRTTLLETRRWSADGDVLVCPRHAWEFDVADGHSLARAGVRLVSYPVHVEDGEVVLTV